MKGLGWLLLALPVMAEEVPVSKKLRQDENWSAWCQSNSPQYGYKCFEPWQGSLLSLGGEIRWRYEYTSAPAWGDEPQDQHGVFMQRYVAFADWHVAPALRLFGQFNSALASGRAGGPSAVDENRLSIQQAFVQWSPAVNTQLVLGRQELNLGSGRLIDVREGPNVRRRFDVARVRLDLRQWQLDILAARPWLIHPGSFDDRLDHQQALWGIYVVNPELSLGLPGNKVDLYYLGYRNRQAVYAQGEDDELRHTVGARFWGEQGAWIWNWELIYQFGHFGQGNIRAWSIASDTRRLLKGQLKSALGLSANIASGDNDPDDADLGTFNALFPRGNYFSELALLGPRNFYNLQPYFTVNPFPWLELTGAVDFYWRLSADDGIYSPGGKLLRDGLETDSRYVATELSINAALNLSSTTAFTIIYGRSFPGPVIRDTGKHEQTDFVELTFKVIF
ncbi:alginate export family protein [Chromatiaceae bacterium AAb-1]|nr:alginate export family protein [Chromatiaceae bacterium AAb-1]